MALIGNYCVLNKTPGRWFGGNSTSHASGVGASAHNGQRSNWSGSGEIRNNALMDGSTSALALLAYPTGYNGTGWMMPMTEGALSSHSANNFTFTFTGSGNYGRNIDSSVTFDVTINQAALSLIVGAAASVPFSVTVNQAALGGTQNMASTFTGVTFVVSGNISAESGLATTATFSFTANGSTLRADGALSAVISGATEAVTPESVAAAVWEAVSAVYNTAGSMGAKLNAAASAGDPWTTTLPGSYLAGTAGQIIGTLQNDINLHTDSAISTLNLQELKFAIESLRPHHTAYGTAYFWNPASGDDSADGLTPATARKTFASIQANLVTDYGHDIVYCLPDGNGTTSAEPITVTKNYLFIRGPGRDFEIDSTTVGGTAVTILADGVELHGVRVKTDSASSADAILITGDFAYIDQVWVDSCGGNAISINSSSNTIINGGYYRAYKANGVNVGNSVNHLWIKDAGFHGTSSGTGSGIYINGTSVFEVKLYGRCDIHANKRYGLEIVNASSRISISPDTLFETNTIGDVYDPLGKVVYDGRITIQNETAPVVWANTTRTLTSSAAPTAADIWSYGNYGALLTLLGKFSKNKMVTDPVAGTITLYDDDGTTPLLSANVYESSDTSTPYNGKGINHRGAMA